MLDALLPKSLKNDIYNIPKELKKIGVLRIITGIIIFVRYLELLLFQMTMSDFNGTSIVLILFLCVALFFILGFLTPIFTIILLLSMPCIDAILAVNTLGTTIGISVLVVLFLVNSGTYYSVDSKVLRCHGFVSVFFKKVYSVIGSPRQDSIKKAYFLGFVMYATSSFFAIMLHFQDVYWLEGVTIKSMLSNSFLCKQAFLFRNIEMNYPLLVDVFSITGVILQTIFQVIMLPLFFFKYGNRFIKIWGFIFFIISLLLLSLSYLPHLEIVLWIIIFCPILQREETKSLREEEVSTFIKPMSNAIVSKIIYYFYLASILIFALLNSSLLPYVLGHENFFNNLKRKNLIFSKHIGIEAPQVFNNIDLSMGDHFMTIKKRVNNNWVLLPITGEKGERLNYLNFDIGLFTNHNSDLLYFGQTLKYRRSLIPEIENVEAFHKKGFGKEHIAFLIKYDYIRSNETSVVQYKVEVFKSKSSKVKRFEFDAERHRLDKIYTDVLNYNGKILK